SLNVTKRLDKFRSLRNEAQLQTVRLGEIDPAEHLKSLRATTSAALAIYAQDPWAPTVTWSLAQPLPDALAPAEKAGVRGGCYDLLLILSEAGDPSEGLKVLDCAARLHPEPTAAYHFRRAACLARAHDPAGKTREEELARKVKPSTALDHF